MHKLQHVIVMVLSVLVSCSANAAAERILHVITEQNWEPYWIMSPESSAGILNDFMLELNPRLPYEVTNSERYSVNRSRQAFTAGEVVMECCLNRVWRNPIDSTGTTLWSDTVLKTEEVIVYPRHRSFPVNGPEDLQGKTISTILGYGYIWSDQFIRIDSVNNLTQIKMVAKGRADGAIIDRLELKYLLKHYPEIQAIKHLIEIGPVINQTDLKIRVHSSHPELIEPINEAIREIKGAGLLDEITARYTENQSEPSNESLAHDTALPGALSNEAL